MPTVSRITLDRRRVATLFATLALAVSLAVLPGCGGDRKQATDGAAAQEAVELLTSGEGAAIQQVDDGEPDFTDDELSYARDNLGYEQYSDLDDLGRCGAAEACLGPETMPAPGEERGEIYWVHPTGWQSVRYDFVDGGSLYNRSHLIAWSLSAENANEENLVTGTRYMNAESMQLFENEVAAYIDETGNHVLYRVTPVFEDDELVCRGVQMEALSLEDDGEGVSFDVVCRNIQPGVEIDYETGDNWESDDTDAAGDSEVGEQEYVLNTRSRRFHEPECESVEDSNPRNLKEFFGSRGDAIALGYEPCGSCRP